MQVIFLQAVQRKTFGFYQLSATIFRSDGNAVREGSDYSSIMFHALKTLHNVWLNRRCVFYYQHIESALNGVVIIFNHILWHNKAGTEFVNNPGRTLFIEQKSI